MQARPLCGFAFIVSAPTLKLRLAVIVLMIISDAAVAARRRE